MTVNKLLVLMIGLSVLCVGCESVQPIAENTPSIVIKKPEHRAMNLMGLNVDFPAGVYAPDFQTKEGIYYLAPTMLVWNALGTHRPPRGGLFIPNQSNPDQRQASWLDQEEDAVILTAGMSSTTRLFRFSEPIPFEIQNLMTVK
jgi:hypothetical protein